MSPRGGIVHIDVLFGTDRASNEYSTYSVTNGVLFLYFVKKYVIEGFPVM
jgi:hypothetical protein